VNAFLGRALVGLALAAAAAGSVVAFSTGRRPSPAARRWVHRAVLAFSALIVLANLVMERALLTHDFSVSYVAHVGSRSTPTWVTMVSLWSSLEGSILFWGLVLGVYVAVAAVTLRRRHPELIVYAEGVWLGCAAFFCLLMAGPAQPFATVLRPATDGPGPNPLLQNHYLMAIHPPFLYCGYVGMTIPFGLACSALLVGRLGPDFLKPIRTWLLVPWVCLTVAIALGGWWSYEVLGWGGYWAWDPVENASLLPWLTATAAVHSILLTERKGILKGWSVTLIQATFLLTILGTFMTRSGVFNSVHSFTQSAIGPTLLVFLGLVALASVVLLATRVDALTADAPLRSTRSREAMVLVNNLVLVLLTFTVLLGTAFPLIVEAVRGLQMSVGRPYFDRMVVPLGAALLFLMGAGPALPWGSASGKEAARALAPPLVGGALLATVGLALGARNPWTVITLLLAGFALQVTARELLLPVRERMRAHGENPLRAFVEANWNRGRRRLGGYLVHAGVAVAIVAIAVSSTMSTSKEVQLRKGDQVTVGAYTLRFTGSEEVHEPNRQALVAHVAVARDGASAGTLDPRMNFYPGQREPVGTPAVRSAVGGDLYLSMMNVDDDGASVGLLVMVKPLVSWIWASVALMALGGIIAVVPRRRVAATLLAEARSGALAPAARPAR
jgi:cytochrome c-type biogenesis protein CcmF